MGKMKDLHIKLQNGDELNENELAYMKYKKTIEDQEIDEMYYEYKNGEQKCSKNNNK
jgi:hypothetical protein